MHSYSRRDFARLMIAGIPISAGLTTQRLWAGSDLRVGLTTESFRELPRVPGRDNIDDVVRSVQASGVREIELWTGNAQPAAPNSGPAAIPPPSAYPASFRAPTPEEIAFARAARRSSLRQWRLGTPDNAFGDMRRKFDAAGLAVYAYRVDVDDTFADAEIERTFAQARALRVGLVSASVTLPVARRLAPFAERAGLVLSLENQTDPTQPGAVASLAQFETALALSKSIRLKLDVGALTAANVDPVAVLTRFRSQITHVQVTDRTRNGGKSQKFGDGDAPIAAVLAAVASRDDRMPVFVNYEYVGLGTAAEEVARCLEYVRRAAG